MIEPPVSRALRVGILAPISWRVPPRHYGPWEQFVSLLTEGLVRRGVEVTLFATGDSRTQATLHSVVPVGYSEDGTFDVKVAEAMHISAFFEQASKFDILHNSYDFLPLCFSHLVETPMVTTIHGFSSPQILPVYRKYNERSHYVAISDADRDPSLHYTTTIHHGIDLSSLQLGTGLRDYLLFFGRIHPDKGTKEAIAAAKEAKFPLVIAGIIQDQEYFDREVLPHVDGDQVRFIGPVKGKEKGQILGGARALLHLINFDEPFGFSVVEAMACGTPVIATRRGSMSELIVDGVNGTLVQSHEDVAIPESGQFAPAVVRASIAERFTQERMVSDYLALYQQILASPSQGAS